MMIKIATGTKNVAFHERKSEPKPNIFRDIPINRDHNTLNTRFIV